MKIRFYKRLNLSCPVIENNKLVKNNDYNGEFITYKVRTHHVLKYENNIINFEFVLPSLKKSKIVHYFRPLKETWDRSKHPLAINLWGKSNNPLTNLIVELNKEKEDFEEKLKNGSIHVKCYVKNTVLSKYIRNHSTNFKIKN